MRKTTAAGLAAQRRLCWGFRVAAHRSRVRGPKTPQAPSSWPCTPTIHGMRWCRSIPSRSATRRCATGCTRARARRWPGNVTVTLLVDNNRITCLETAQDGETQSVGGFEAVRDGTFAKMIEAAAGLGHRHRQRGHHHHGRREAGRRRRPGPGGECARRPGEIRQLAKGEDMSKHDSEARGITRRGFLSAACAVVGTTAATAAMPAGCAGCGAGRHRRLDGPTVRRTLPVPGSAAHQRQRLGRHIPRAQRRDVPGKRRPRPFRPGAAVPRDVGLQKATCA